MIAHTLYPDDLLSNLPKGVKRALAEVVLQRSIPVLRRIFLNATADELREALAAPTDVGMLARLLSTAGREDAVRALDPLATAYARGAEVKQEMLKDAGGAWTVEQVQKHLGGITRQAVDKRRQRGTLLAVRQSGNYLYPVCQFDQTGVLAGLPDILRRIRSESSWTKLSVLLAQPISGSHETVLEAVRAGDLQSARHTANTWGEHGAP